MVRFSTKECLMRGHLALLSLNEGKWDLLGEAITQREGETPKLL